MYKKDYIIQSYEVYTAPDVLRQRHPYTDPPFPDQINLNQITHAVWDRSIQKFAQVLIFKDLSRERKRDALITLNKLVSHQQTMDQMISYEIVTRTSNLLDDQFQDVRQQASILLGNFALSKLAIEQFDEACELLPKLLTDKQLKVREASAWALYKLSLSRQGCERLVHSHAIDGMIAAFMHYMQGKNMAMENGRFFIYLLEGFIDVSNYDLGIKPFLKQHNQAFGIIHRLTEILKRDTIIDLKDYIQRIQQLQESLKVLGHLSYYHGPTEETTSGAKKQCIDSKTILSCWRYLDSQYYAERLNASVILMSVSVHLTGKDQIVYDEKLPILSPTLLSSQQQVSQPNQRSQAKLSDLPAPAPAAMSEAPLTSQIPQPSDDPKQPSEIPVGSQIQEEKVENINNNNTDTDQQQPTDNEGQEEDNEARENEQIKVVEQEQNEAGDNQGRPAIIAKIVERLNIKTQTKQLRDNLKITLHNVAELPAGFLAVSSELAPHSALFEEIFGTKAIVGISLLLPKITDYQNPFDLSGQDQQMLKCNHDLIQALGYVFYKHESAAAIVAATQCINLVQKLVPYINILDSAMKCILLIASEDDYSCFLLKKLITEYGGKKFQGTRLTLKQVIEQYSEISNKVLNAQILT